MSSKKAGPRARRSRSRGQGLVEFALVIPIFLMILFAILDFGWLLYSRITLINATREAAHAAIIQTENAQGIRAIVNSAVQANVTGLIWKVGTAPSDTATVTTTCQDFTPINNIACDLTVADSLGPGDTITVVTTYKYPSFFGRFINVAVPLSASVTMVLE